MAEMRKDEQVVVERSSFNLGGIIAAIAFLILVLGVLTYFGAMPF